MKIEYRVRFDIGSRRVEIIFYTLFSGHVDISGDLERFSKKFASLKFLRTGTYIYIEVSETGRNNGGVTSIIV